MTIVVDASAIIALVTSVSPIVRHVREATRVVTPDLAVAETLNVRHRYRHAGLPAPELDRLLDFFDRIEIVSSRAYAIDADLLSLQLDHPAYDCLYAAVAKRERGRLLTADRRFAHKIAKYEVDVVAFAADAGG